MEANKIAPHAFSRFMRLRTGHTPTLYSSLTQKIQEAKCVAL